MPGFKGFATGLIAIFGMVSMSACSVEEVSWHQVGIERTFDPETGKDLITDIVEPSKIIRFNKKVSYEIVDMRRNVYSDGAYYTKDAVEAEISLLTTVKIDYDQSSLSNYVVLIDKDKSVEDVVLSYIENSLKRAAADVAAQYDIEQLVFNRDQVSREIYEGAVENLKDFKMNLRMERVHMMNISVSPLVEEKLEKRAIERQREREAKEKRHPGSSHQKTL